MSKWFADGCDWCLIFSLSKRFSMELHLHCVLLKYYWQVEEDNTRAYGVFVQRLGSFFGHSIHVLWHCIAPGIHRIHCKSASQGRWRVLLGVFLGYSIHALCLCITPRIHCIHCKSASQGWHTLFGFLRLLHPYSLSTSSPTRSAWRSHFHWTSPLCRSAKVRCTYRLPSLLMATSFTSSCSVRRTGK